MDAADLFLPQFHLRHLCFAVKAHGLISLSHIFGRHLGGSLANLATLLPGGKKTREKLQQSFPLAV